MASLLGNQTIVRLVGAVALSALAGIAPLACGNGNSSAPPATSKTTASPATSHAIHVFISQPDGSKRQVDFGPGTDMSLGISGTTTPTAKPTRALGRAAGRTTMSGTATVEDPGTDIQATAWELVARAADACFFDGEFGGDPLAQLPPWGVREIVDEAYAENWYVYAWPFPTSYCADRLYLEQNLVCVADKLAAIADAVGDVSWPALTGPNYTDVCGSNNNGTYTYGDAAGFGDNDSECSFFSAWDIPPQADADRFIVRDLAIHTLAMIPMMDSYTDILNQSCATSFAQVASGALPVDPVQNSANILSVFGVSLPGGATDTTMPQFPPSNVPYVGNMPAIAATALDVNAQVLRSGARLLHDLVRRDVYSDLAAASQQAGQALSPLTSNMAAWGAQDGGSLYGTIAHASRVLLGRWEIGTYDPTSGIPSTVADPQCEGVSELNLLPSAFGSDFAARYSDRAIRTPGEQTAVQFVERSGIVLPACSITPGLKPALIAQLLLEEQVQNNLPSPLPQTALNDALQGVSDDELVFAFTRALLTWELLTNTGDPSASTDGGAPSCAGFTASPLLASDGTLPAGLTMATYPAGWPQTAGQPMIDKSVSGLMGIVVQGGLSRSRLATDPIARAGGMTAASQCSDVTDFWDEWGQGTPALYTGLAQGGTAAFPTVNFQDAFQIGQALERRLNLLDSVATGLSQSDPSDVARGGIAELRTWAGATIVHAWPQFTGGAFGSFVVRVGGMSYASDFNFASTGGAPNATQLQALGNAFGFVYGPPWVAECAAGVRADCPANFRANYVQTGVAADVTGGTDQAGNLYKATGVLDNVFTLTVPLTGGVPKFNSAAAPIPIPDPSTPSESHLYMVLLRDPTSPTGRGRVLGTLPLQAQVIRDCFGGRCSVLSATPLITGFVDAPMQRELVHDAIDLGSWVGARPPAIGDPSASDVSGYCVDGVPRDLFVPLDNELVSGTQTYEDSWQAYLSLAQTAAQTADTLGQQLIANDLQISQNQQAAEEQLANLCGDFGALSTAKVANNGQITADTNDPNTQACLGNNPDGGKQLVDVVFLGQMPTTITQAGTTDPAYTAAIKKAINCTGGTNGGPPASAVALCNQPTLTADYLNVTAQPDGGAMDDGGLITAACGDILNNVAPSLRKQYGPSLDVQSYLTDLQDPSQNPTGIEDIIAQLKMTVDVHDNWQVYYGQNTKIMDSVDVAYWPACLDTDSCTNQGAAASNQVNSITKVMSTGWSWAFRACPNGINLNADLGSCDGDRASELNLLKWRVTQAMWMLAASAGVVPPGMILQPIPAILTGSQYISYQTGTNSIECDNNNPCVENGAAVNYFPAGLANYYAEGDLQGTSCSAGSNCVTPTLGNEGSIHQMTPLFDIEPGFRAFGSDSNINGDGNGEIPYWYSLLYSAADTPGAKHYFAVNGAVSFDQCNKGYQGQANPFPPQGGCGSSSSSSSSGSAVAAQTSFSDLVGSAETINGALCILNYGEPDNLAGPPTTYNGGPPWAAVVGTVKAGVDAAGTTTSAGVNGANFSLPTSSFGFTSWDESYFVGNKAAGPTYGGYVGTWAPGESTGNNMLMAPVEATAWSPSARAVAFAGYGAAPNGTCGAISLLIQASTLACTPPPAVSMAQTVNMSGPPQVSTLNDVPVLEAWLAKTSSILNGAAGSFYLQEVPQQVVQDVKNGTVGSGAIGGSRGQAILTMEQQIQQLNTAWVSLASDLGSISQDIAIANGNITGAKLTQESSDGALAFQTIQTQASMAASVDQFLMTLSEAADSSWSSFGSSEGVMPAATLTLATALSYGNQELSQLSSEANTNAQIEQNSLYLALANLSANTMPLWKDIQTQLDNLRASVAQIDASGQSIVLAQGQAAYQLAVGTGSDFVSVAGQEVPIPVDTVLRRQSSATLQRYQAALTNAKALAYMARRAIEQRIGVPLDALTQQVGPVAAPASWADNICSLTGVNYASLSTAVPDGSPGGGIGGTVDTNAISQFADAWVGDYIAELQNFVTYYNVQYPSHQGEDTAVLSLRYDLLSPTSQCMAPGPNLLTNSGDLSQFSTASWQLTPCQESAQKCLAVIGGYALPPPQDGPDGTPAVGTASGVGSLSGVTWLLDVPEATPDAGAPADGGANPDAGVASSPVSGGPRNLVVQQVSLPAGTYVLSWWDQARDANGNVVYSNGATPPNYLAQVFDSTWSTAVARFDAEPYRPPPVGQTSVPSLWSARNARTFTVTNAGTYFVTFAASSLTGAPGSVAVANVQLEATSNGEPSPYVGTSATTSVPAQNCPMSDADLRAAFTHVCDPNGACHYDLTMPFVIDTSALDGSPQGAKFASGNYNYRHITTALNVVGTGVHSCANDPTPNCYGSGYVQYNLQHDAQTAGIVGYDGNSRIFDFGVANISGGKALAAEQYMTVPLSSNDEQLISQPGIEHVELGGRPVDGTYHLRIWDSPDLNWNALQDIQLILDYEYWSQIQVTSDTAQVRHPQRLQRAPIKPIPRSARGR